MTNFLDWLGAPGGDAQALLARRFDARPEDIGRATEALGPAYLLGLQRLAGDVERWTSLMQTFVRPIPGTAPPPALALSFFGNDALTSAVAGEAARRANLPTEMITAMMPTLSAMTVEAVMRMAAPGSRQAMPGDPVGAATAEMLRRSANAVEAFSRPSTGPAGALSPFPFLDMFALPFAAMGRAPASAPSPATPDVPMDALKPAAAFLAAFTKGLSTQNTASSPHAEVETETSDPLAALLSATQSAQGDYLRQMAALFGAHPPASPAARPKP